MGEWEEAFNKPEKSGVWFIYAGSTGGKSEFVMQLAKCLARFDKVLYNSLEEGTALSFRKRMDRNTMSEVKGRFEVVMEDKVEFDKRIAKRKSPQVLIIDSLPYFIRTWKDYLALKNECLRRGKTLVIVGHGRGKNPKGDLAERIAFDAYMKIYVEGYKAICKGREIGPNGGEFIIWEEGANRYWGEIEQEKKSKKK